MSEPLADALVARYRWLILAGVVLSVGSRSVGPGNLTGLMLLWLGAFGGAFREWRTEPGLWRLSALFLPVSGLPWVLNLAGLIREPHLEVSLESLDLALAVSLHGLELAFLATVTSTNWGVGRGRKPLSVDEL